MVVNAVRAADANHVVPDATVTEQVLILEAARARKQAREAADRGDFGAAASMLRTSAAMMRSAGDQSTMPTLFADVDDLDATAVSMTPNEYDGAAAKHLWAQEQASTKGRRTRFDDEPEA